MKKIALLVIDGQKDFMDIPGAALPVPGAVKDMERLAQFMEKADIATIFASMDSHYSLDIAHPTWWKKPDGSFVDPFTLITSTMIENGEFSARIDPVGSLNYVKQLEADGEFLHFIWPEHCLIGTDGHALHPVFFNAIKEWMRKKLRWVNFIRKGENPYTEHFGIFRANVPIMDDASTQVNQGIFKTLNDHDEIILAGEAQSHCVANSLRQLMQIAPNLATKLIVAEDGMSAVQGLPSDFYDSVAKIYSDAYAMGVRSAKLADL